VSDVGDGASRVAIETEHLERGSDRPGPAELVGCSWKYRRVMAQVFAKLEERDPGFWDTHRVVLLGGSAIRRGKTCEIRRRSLADVPVRAPARDAKSIPPAQPKSLPAIPRRGRKTVDIDERVRKTLWHGGKPRRWVLEYIAQYKRKPGWKTVRDWLIEVGGWRHGRDAIVRSPAFQELVRAVAHVQEGETWPMARARAVAAAAASLADWLQVLPLLEPEPPHPAEVALSRLTDSRDGLPTGWEPAYMAPDGDEAASGFVGHFGSSWRTLEHNARDDADAFAAARFYDGSSAAIPKTRRKSWLLKNGGYYARPIRRKKRAAASATVPTRERPQADTSPARLGTPATAASPRPTREDLDIPMLPYDPAASERFHDYWSSVRPRPLKGRTPAPTKTNFIPWYAPEAQIDPRDPIWDRPRQRKRGRLRPPETDPAGRGGGRRILLGYVPGDEPHLWEARNAKEVSRASERE
jgi:hypothetical protein